MFGNVTRRFNKNILFRKCNLCIHRSETTSIVKSKLDEQWEKKMKFYMKAYEDAFGITKLSEMHDRVIEVQNNIQLVQEQRRKVQEEIFAVQKKLQESQDVLRKISMSDDMYISVVTQVCDLLKEQTRLKDLFSLYDQTEREQYATLNLAIKNSHDHERTHRERNKYLSLITGLIGGFLGLVGSSINNWRHRKEIRLFAEDVSNQYKMLYNDLFYLKKSAEEQKWTPSTESSISSEAKDSIQHWGTPDQISRIEERLDEYDRNYDIKLKQYTYTNMGVSASLLGSSTLIFTLVVYYLIKNS